MDLEHGLVVEAAAAVGAAVGEELAVEAFEVVDPQMPEGDPADVRDDVEVDVAPVAVPGAGPK